MRPSSQQVAVAWVQSLPELVGVGVATTLPPQKQWGGQDFVTVSANLGGIPVMGMMTRMPVLQIDSWAQAPNSTRPAWNRASMTAEAIRDAAYGSDSYCELTFAGGFMPVSLEGVRVLSEPRRLSSDTAAIARCVLTLQFYYTPAGLVSA